jgi:hypothetical protein
LELETKNIGLRCEAAEMHLRNQVEEMLSRYRNRLGRWDLELMRIELTSHITKAREDARRAALAVQAGAMQVG